MAAVLTGRWGDGASVRGDLPGGDALVLAEQVHARVDSARCEKAWGSSQGARRCAVLSPGRTSSGLAQAGSFSHSALGRGSPPDLSEPRPAITSVRRASSRSPRRIITVQIGGYARVAVALTAG
jgi:hypothetical protein